MFLATNEWPELFKHFLGIALLDYVSTLIVSTLLNLMQRQMHSNTFRYAFCLAYTKGKSCTDVICLLNCILAKTHEWRSRGEPKGADPECCICSADILRVWSFNGFCRMGSLLCHGVFVYVCDIVVVEYAKQTIKSEKRSSSNIFYFSPRRVAHHGAELRGETQEEVPRALRRKHGRIFRAKAKFPRIRFQPDRRDALAVLLQTGNH